MRTFFFSVLVFILLASGVRQLKANTPKDSDFNPQSFTEEKSSSSRKIKVSGKALKPENILVKEGDSIEPGQPLITRQFEIDTLESQRSKVLEKVEFISSQQILKPIEPISRDYPSLPHANFDADTLRISAIQSRCDRMRVDLDSAKSAEFSYLSAASVDKLEQSKQHKSRELNQAKDLLSNLRSLDFEAHYVTHQEEVVKSLTEEVQQIDGDILVELGKIQEKLSLAQISKANAVSEFESKLSDCEQQLQISQANLIQSKYQREILEQDYERSLAIHLQEQDRNKQNYQRDMVEYNQAIETQRLALFDANSSLDQIDLKLSEITEVKSPYEGKISRVKIVDSVDGFINVEFTLVY
jgi:biotin carboxyl carrier protein